MKSIRRSTLLPADSALSVIDRGIWSIRGPRHLQCLLEVEKAAREFVKALPILHTPLHRIDPKEFATPLEALGWQLDDLAVCERPGMLAHDPSFQPPEEKERRRLHLIADESKKLITQLRKLVYAPKNSRLSWDKRSLETYQFLSQLLELRSED